MHECEKCSRSFESKRGLDNHKGNCGNKKKTKECPTCKEEINIYGYHGHLKAHEHDTKCPNCDEVVRGKRNKFCNHSCSASYSNKGVVRNGKPAANCLNCEEKLRGSKAKYCSNKCQYDHEQKTYVEEWKLGRKSGRRGEGVSNYIRRYLFEKYDSKCCKCGWAEVNPTTELIPLTIDHVNGDPYDNREENLELICPNCHSLTPTYGKLNAGNGRRKRSEEIRKYKLENS